ncbi:HIT family protein [Blattabacterium cuenoti]|uniref:HIT family protein n=1 Tax=Blattabacterium cuenoti TaxID=1653831 RepID=UPI00163D1130|nr:HIT family protein [Blattabacterium cuenoti]
MKNNIFSKIIMNQIPCYKVAETVNQLAFLDIYPMKIGHTLVIPKKNIDNIFSLNEKEFVSIMSFTQKVAIGIKKIIPCNRIGMFIMGFEISHAHIHLIPMDKESDANFSKNKIQLSDQQFKIISEQIKIAIN